jgi:hypothetical protein
MVKLKPILIQHYACDGRGFQISTYYSKSDESFQVGLLFWKYRITWWWK